jgi:drug/metabolite transporter (DMT)-like permease
MATAGLYFLSVNKGLTLEKGDFLVLIGAFAWALHVQIIGWLGKSLLALLIAVVQFGVCAGLSLGAALAFEEFSPEGIYEAAIPILYAGLLSTGIAYTLQVVGQKKALPAPAAIILSLEAVFAAIGGGLILGETMTPRNLLGCGLMLGGMLLSQVKRSKVEGPKSKV